MLSNICSFIFLFSTVPVISSILSASVLLPWSMWAIMEKFLMFLASIQFVVGADISKKKNIFFYLFVYHANIPCYIKTFIPFVFALKRVRAEKKTARVIKKNISSFHKSVFDFFRKFGIILFKMLMKNDDSHNA